MSYIPGGGADNDSDGTFTPTLTIVANLDAATPYGWWYVRVDNTIFFGGKIDVNPTLTATATRVRFTLPVSSVLASQDDLAGNAFASGVAGMGAALRADVASAEGELVFISSDITNQSMYLSGTYQVLA